MDDSWKFVAPARGKALVNWGHPQARFVRDVLSRGLSVGKGIDQDSGLMSDHFFRLDDVYNSAISCKKITAFHSLLIVNMRLVISMERINQIGLIIRKREGNKAGAGFEQLAGLLGENGLNFFQIRLGQRLWARAIDPQIASQLSEKSRVLLLIDADLAGMAIYEAACIIRQLFCGKLMEERPVIVPFSIYEYLRGAREKLHMKDIKSYSLIDWFFFHDIRLLPENMEMRQPVPRLLFESAAGPACAAFR